MLHDGTHDCAQRIGFWAMSFGAGSRVEWFDEVPYVNVATLWVSPGHYLVKSIGNGFSVVSVEMFNQQYEVDDA